MTRTALLRSWLVAPPLAGKWTALWVIAGLPVAALIRTAMDCPNLVGECCTPFFMFVLLSAILLGWKAAFVAALTSAIASALVSTYQGIQMDWDASEFWGLALFFF